jgi:hypothetical protein
MDESDSVYFRRRAQLEMENAHNAASAALAARHLQLAQIYLSRALHAERDEELRRAG